MIRDGVRYFVTTVEVREDLHAEAKARKWNLKEMLNHAILERMIREHTE